MSYCSLSLCDTLHGCTMFSGGNPGSGSGRGLLDLVVVACSLMEISLLVPLVQIIQKFEGTTCTSIGALVSGASILSLMILCMNSLLTTQDKQQKGITGLHGGLVIG